MDNIRCLYPSSELSVTAVAQQAIRGESYNSEIFNKDDKFLFFLPRLGQTIYSEVDHILYNQNDNQRHNRFLTKVPNDAYQIYTTN